MATEIVITFTIGDRKLLLSARPAAMAKMLDQVTDGKVAALFKKIVADRFGTAEVQEVLPIFERDPAVLEYFEQVVADDTQAQAEAREAAAMVVMAAEASRRMAAK